MPAAANVNRLEFLNCVVAASASEMEVIIPGITTPAHCVRLQARRVPAGGD